MRLLTSNELSSTEIYGGSVLTAALVGGLVNSAVWAGWTVFMDNCPEKVTAKKAGLTFSLGALATYTATWVL